MFVFYKSFICKIEIFSFKETHFLFFFRVILRFFAVSSIVKPIYTGTNYGQHI